MPRGVYERKNKKSKHVVVSGNARVQALASLATCRTVMSLQVPKGGAVIKLTNDSDRVIGTLELTEDGLLLSRPNQKKKPDRILSYVALSRLMELGLL